METNEKMKQLKKRIFLKRMSDADLNKESANAASYYVTKKGKGAPLVDQQKMINFVAHGFYMGYRKLEEELLGEKKDAGESYY